MKLLGLPLVTKSVFHGPPVYSPQETSRFDGDLIAKAIASSNPFSSASKSLILREKTSCQVFSRDFRGLAAVSALVAYSESEFLALCTFSVGHFSKHDFASGFLELSPNFGDGRAGQAAAVVG
jgi:hypothetical protein